MGSTNDDLYVLVDFFEAFSQVLLTIGILVQCQAAAFLFSNILF